MKKCTVCGKKVKVFRKKKCNNCYRRLELGNKCKDCGEPIYSVSTRCMSCSAKNKKNRPNPKNRGANNGRWNGGKREGNHGYLEVLVGVQKYKREHRIVVEEEVLKRPLKKGEVVHHINGDKKDNRPENLLVFDDNSAHMHFHKLLRDVKGI